MINLKIIRVTIGILLLLSVVWLAVNHGQFLQQIEIKAFTIVLTMNIAAIFLNSMLLQWTTKIFETPLNIRESILIASSGALINSAGGLPFGTATVFIVLIKKHGYSLSKLLIGKIIATLLCILCLLIFLGISSLINKQFAFSTAIISLGILGLFIIKILPSISFIPEKTQETLTSLLKNHFCTGLIIAIITTSTMLSSYWYAIHHYEPSLLPNDAFAISCIGIFASFLMMANTIGGLNEIILGIVSTMYNLTFIDGIDIGLFNRVCAITASSLVYLISLQCFKIVK